MSGLSAPAPAIASLAGALLPSERHARKRGMHPLFERRDGEAMAGRCKAIWDSVAIQATVAGSMSAKVAWKGSAAAAVVYKTLTRR